MAIDSTAPEAAKKGRNVRYTYRDFAGEVVESFNENIRSVIYNIEGYAGTAPEADLARLVPDDLAGDDDARRSYVQQMPAMLRMAALLGFKTTVQNALAGKGDETPETKATLVQDRIDTIYDGEWREGGERGPRIKHILDAIAAMVLRGRGSALDQTEMAALTEQVKKAPKVFLADADISAEIAAQEAERAAAKAAVAKSKAGTGEGLLSKLGLATHSA